VEASYSASAPAPTPNSSSKTSGSRTAQQQPPAAVADTSSKANYAHKSGQAALFSRPASADRPEARIPTVQSVPDTTVPPEHPSFAMNDYLQRSQQDGDQFTARSTAARCDGGSWRARQLVGGQKVQAGASRHFVGSRANDLTTVDAAKCPFLPALESPAELRTPGSPTVGTTTDSALDWCSR